MEGLGAQQVSVVTRQSLLNWHRKSWKKNIHIPKCHAEILTSDGHNLLVSVHLEEVAACTMGCDTAQFGEIIIVERDQRCTTTVLLCNCSYYIVTILGPGQLI